MAKLPEVYYKEKAEKLLKQQQIGKENAKKKAAKKEERVKYIEEHMEEILLEKEKERQLKLLEKERKLPVQVTNPSIKNRRLKLGKLYKTGNAQYKMIPRDKKDNYKHCVDKEVIGREGNEIKSSIIQDYILEDDRQCINNQISMIDKYFYPNDIIPLYNKYICSCCGQVKSIEEFPRSFSFADLARVDEGMYFHKPICRVCANKLFYYHYHETCKKNELLAMERWCCDTNTYWDEKCYVSARKAFDNNPNAVNMIPNYLSAVNRMRKFGATYWDSPTIKNRFYTVDGYLKAFPPVFNPSNYIAPIDWDKEEIKVKRKIINLMRYDPFENETEEDKKVMYRNLELMIDEAMSDDLMKLKAAIEIVRSYQKIEHLRRQEQELEKNGATTKEISDIANMRNKELQQITVFSRDNGFGDKYATKKSKGAGTLTGCMNEMKEKNYEDGLVNFYGVKTCKEMQDVANMSMEAIFSQLSLTENEAFQMVAKQTKRIEALQEELEKTKETLRYKEIEIKRLQLLYKARKNGVIEPEDQQKLDEEVEKVHFTKKEEKELLPSDLEAAEAEYFGGDLDGN